MFVLTTVVDTIRIPPNMLSMPTMAAVHSEMDRRYPNRVLMDVGLVISRYGNCLRIGDGICVNGDGGAHHECLVKLVVFRPFVEEVCLGKIVKSTADGIQVSIGFFEDIFIPPYWMLRPSHYDATSGLWVWTPNYDEEDEDGGETTNQDKQPAVKTEIEEDTGKHTAAVDASTQDLSTADNEDEVRYEMEIGAEIRFKVKSINFTQITNTAKGMQATTTTTAHSQSSSLHPNMMGGSGSGSDTGNVASGGENADTKPVRKRSISVDLTTSQSVPATMHVVASICEDGLGLTSWWASQEEHDESGDENSEDR